MALRNDPSQPVPKLTDADRDPQTDVGHYFDQVFFDTHIALQSARSETQKSLSELDALGVVIDPETGAVTFAPKPNPDGDA